MSLQHFMDTYALKLLQAIFVHLGYVVLCVAIGSAIALVLAVLLTRIPRFSKLIMPVLSILQTIPGIVVIGILYLYTGMRPITVMIALSVYAIFPVLKNAYSGILHVDEKYKEAAKGCGMSSWQTLFYVELPLATPSIFTGIRMTVIYLVSWTVLAAMIGQGGLGEFIYRGVGTNDNRLILMGAVPAAVMAIGLGALLDKLQKKLTPRGIRLQEQSESGQSSGKGGI